MQIPEFDSLSERYRSALLLAPAYVSALIAGADGKIDRKEIQQAVSTAQNKQNQSRPMLQDYYQTIGYTFEEDLTRILDELPKENEERELFLIEKLEDVSWGLGKLPGEFAVQLYSSLKEFAKKIAESSGGILGFLSVGYEESRLVDLKMIKDPSK